MTPEALDLSDAEFERVSRIFAPYFRELGVALPARPERFSHRFDDQVAALLEANPPVFSFVFGVPSPAILSECRQRGIVTIGAATTIAEARVLEEAGVDLLVATGSDAGGHRPSFLKSAEDSLTGTFSLVPLVADRVKRPRHCRRRDRRCARRACRAGTRCAGGADRNGVPRLRGIRRNRGAPRDPVQRTRAGNDTDARIFRAPRTRRPQSMDRRDGAAHRRAAAVSIQSWFVSKLRPAAVKAGRTDLVSLWSGQGAPNLRHRTAATLMDALTITPKETRR